MIKFNHIARPAVLLVSLLMAATLLSSTAHAAPTKVSGSTVVQTFDYGPARLTAHYDTSRKNAPWIVDVHGGWWRTGDEDSDYATAERLRARGYQVFTVDYRKAPDAQWPAQRDDVTAAIAWIRARAATFHIDSANVALLGGSAGGHIAVNTAANLPAGQKVKATVGIAAINDPWSLWLGGRTSSTTAAVKGRDNSTLLVGCSRIESAACDSAWADSWAAYHFDPADGQLADWQCDADPTIPLYQGQHLVSKLQSKGVKATLHTVHCASHNPLNTAGVWTQVDTFLDGVLKP